MGTSIWFWVEKIAALLSQKVMWPTTFDTKFVYTIDGTMFRMNEPRDPDFHKNPEWCNHKHRCAGRLKPVSGAMGIHKGRLHIIMVGQRAIAIAWEQLPT
jgi:hypothetical protein